MHAASAPRAPCVPGARGRAARGRAPSQYRRRAATARAKISGKGRDADSDAREATCSARDGEGAADTHASARQACLSQASTAFVAAATAATLALGASAPAPLSARFFRAEAAESAPLRPEAEAALAAERERDRRAAERVVDAFLALSREDQIKVVDRLVFAADADRRAAAANTNTSAETGSSGSGSSVAVARADAEDALAGRTPFFARDADASRDGGSRGTPVITNTPEEDPFAAADARDGWPMLGDDDDPEEKEKFLQNAKRSAESAASASSDDPARFSFEDAEVSAAETSEPSDATSAFARAGETAAAGVRTAAATAALRLSEAAPEGLLAETFRAFRDDAFPFSGFGTLDADAGVPLAFAGLVALAIAPEVRNMAAGAGGARDAAGDAGDGDAGDGDVTRDVTGDIPSARGADRNAGVRRETGPSPADPARPGPGTLWSRRDEGPDASVPSVSADRGRDASASGGVPGSSPGGSGVLWTRAEDDDAAARRRESRKKKGARSRRSGGRNGLEDAPTRATSEAAKKEKPRAARNDGVGRLSLGPPTESLLNQGLGPVEDENMENVRFSPRK